MKKKKIVLTLLLKITFCSCFRPETRQAGLCVVLDAQRSTWKTTKSTMHRVFEVLDVNIGAMLVVRSDVFWDKQRVDNCTKTRTEGEVYGNDVTTIKRHVFFRYVCTRTKRGFGCSKIVNRNAGFVNVLFATVR